MFQVPSILRWLSANGPINAIVPDFLKGNNWLLFFNNTNECSANSLAAFLLSSENISFADLSVDRSLYGSSKRPNLYFASSINLQALSISCCDTLDRKSTRLNSSHV